jgi:hypothetical protein
MIHAHALVEPQYRANCTTSRQLREQENMARNRAAEAQQSRLWSSLGMSPNEIHEAQRRFQQRVTMKEPIPKTIKLSDVERLKREGYTPLADCDAAKANSDYFLVMVKRTGPGADMRVQILCPTFLRGPLGFNSSGGGVSY